MPGGGHPQAAARASDRLAFAHDASHYLLLPHTDVTPQEPGQVAAPWTSTEYDVSLTFRSRGTNLSGQATHERTLADTHRHFRGIEILDAGARVRVQPGATIRAVSTRPARHGRNLGPGYASESACTIGGVAANNWPRCFAHPVVHALTH
ncbi:FAD-binding oxidoreductase [Streptomyces umbrinus]|uniref:FAD-binding oxidoreductase n=1 Tax=Streptomyces umbrinus TaxID=67370 RepID=UPI003C2B2112